MSGRGNGEEQALIPEDNLTEERRRLLSWGEAAVYVVAITAGSGALSLPYAISKAGVYGIVLLMIFTVWFWFTGEILAECFLMTSDRMRENNENLESLHLTPYSTIAEVAFRDRELTSKFSSLLVHVSSEFTLISSGIVYLVLAAQCVHLLSPDSPVTMCYLIIILGFGSILLQLLFHRPRQMWFIAIAVAACSVIASLEMTIYLGYPSRYMDKPDPPEPAANDIFGSIGTLLFAVNGHVLFPHLQADMRNRSEFKKSLRLGFIVIFLVFAPPAIAAYVVYGENVEENLIFILRKDCADFKGFYRFMKYTIAIAMVTQLLLRLQIVLDPICLNMDNYIGRERSTCFKWSMRITNRIVLMGVMVLTSLLLPNYQIVLTLVGATTLVLLAIVCPSIFYIQLCRGYATPLEIQKAPINLSTKKKLLYYLIGTVGAAVMILATYTAIDDISDKSYVTCFYNASLVLDQNHHSCSAG